MNHFCVFVKFLTSFTFINYLLGLSNSTSIHKNITSVILKSRQKERETEQQRYHTAPWTKELSLERYSNMEKRSHRFQDEDGDEQGEGAAQIGKGGEAGGVKQKQGV